MLSKVTINVIFKQKISYKNFKNLSEEKVIKIIDKEIKQSRKNGKNSKRIFRNQPKRPVI